MEKCKLFSKIVRKYMTNKDWLIKHFFFLPKNPVEDGGYWFMAANIIKKHGLMPKMYFPESYSSENSDTLNEILNSKVINYFIKLLQKWIILGDVLKRSIKIGDRAYFNVFFDTHFV